MRAIFILAAALSVSTQAGAAQPLPTALVNIGDIDLGSGSGQRVLAHRIAAAVEEVCGSYANASEPVEQSQVDDCRASAMASARQQLARRSDAVQVAARERR
jgi:UrcA family protein